MISRLGCCLLLPEMCRTAKLSEALEKPFEAISWLRALKNQSRSELPFSSHRPVFISVKGVDLKLLWSISRLKWSRCTSRYSVQSRMLQQHYIIKWPLSLVLVTSFQKLSCFRSSRCLLFFAFVMFSLWGISRRCRWPPKLFDWKPVRTQFDGLAGRSLLWPLHE